MSIHKVWHMNIVPYTGPIMCWKITPKNLHQSCHQNQLRLTTTKHALLLPRVGKLTLDTGTWLHAILAATGIHAIFLQEFLHVLGCWLDLTLFWIWCHVLEIGTNYKKMSTLMESHRPRVASMHAPVMRPNFRYCGNGDSPSRPWGSEPITLKYLQSTNSKISNP